MHHFKHPPSKDIKEEEQRANSLWVKCHLSVPASAATTTEKLDGVRGWPAPHFRVCTNSRMATSHGLSFQWLQWKYSVCPRVVWLTYIDTLFLCTQYGCFCIKNNLICSNFRKFRWRMRGSILSSLPPANWNYRCFNVVTVSIFTTCCTIYKTCSYLTSFWAGMYIWARLFPLSTFSSWISELIPLSVVSLPQPTTDCTQSSWRPRMVGTEKMQQYFLHIFISSRDTINQMSLVCYWHVYIWQ